MENLIQRYRNLLENIDLRFVRYLHGKINWNERLNAILGARGVGKTTMILQHIQLHRQEKESLLVFADDLYFSRHSIVELAEDFFKQGGRYLYIDEIHKYTHWSTEIKNIYDQIPQLHVTYTGSSILDLEKGGADLSRRQRKYYLPGLSFREWLLLAKKIEVPLHSLQQILEGNVTFPYQNHRPISLFKEYLSNGYFPFCMESAYLEKLNAVIEQTIENDIPQFAGLNVGVMRKMRQLMQIITGISPFKPNYSDLARDLAVNRGDLKDYLYYLEKSGMIQQLTAPEKGLNLLAKVEKIYLDNPNMMFALCRDRIDSGTLRETFFFNQTRVVFPVYSSSKADFTIDGNTFEVGGKNKGKKQIAEVEHAYVVRDDIEYPAGNILPLWAFGLLY